MSSAGGDMEKGDRRARPGLSVVLVAPEGYEPVREVIRQLRAQTVKDRVEVVVVGSSAAAPHDAQLDGLAGVVFEAASTRSQAVAFTAGIRAASAPVVALCEDHAYPEPRWAEALIEAHRKPYAAVGPVLVNANPSALSWGNLLLGYWKWVEPAPAGVVDELPSVNVAYKRDALLALGDRLTPLLEREGGVLDALRASGGQLYLEPAARIHHVNVSAVGASVLLRFAAGRLYAATRARRERWPAPRRLLYAAGAPLIPVARYVRMSRELRARGVPRSRDVKLGLVASLGLDAVGQMVGFLGGAGRSRARLDLAEVHRDRRGDVRRRAAAHVS